MLHPASAPTPDIIAHLALSTFASLPRSFKPVIRSNRVPEWTILASIILSIPQPHAPEPQLRLVSLGTGVKCLPTNKLPPCGDALHDSHAEVLAKRGLGRFLLEEAIALSKGPEVGSQVLERIEKDGAPKFRVREGVGVHLYVSALPCGNASTLYTAAHQPRSMADLKDSHLTDTPPSSDASAISRGRNGYSNTTSLRTKPGRPDSFPSISMSCSDKIASWNVLGLQGGLLARWFEPVYLDSVIIGGIGEDPTSEDVVGYQRAAGLGSVGKSWEEAIRSEVEEALYGRLELLEPHLPPPYRLARPAIHFTSLPFPFDKPTISALHPTAEPSPHPTSIASYLSPSSTPISTASSEYVSEHLFNGVDRRASWKAPGLVPIEEKRRSGVCKLEMMRSGLRLESVLRGEDASGLPAGEMKMSYHALKQGTAYQDVKTLLRGKVGPPGVVKGFEKCGELSVTETTATPEELGDGRMAKPPFVGWIVSGKKWESFDSEGNVSGPGFILWCPVPMTCRDCLNF